MLAVHGLNSNITSTEFLFLPELHAGDVLGVEKQSPRFFLEPTPGQLNFPGFVTMTDHVPVFSHGSDTYAEGFSLELTTDAPDGVIRYTLDRTEPTEHSSLYETPRAIDRTTMVRARVFQPGRVPGPTVTRHFFHLDPGVANFSSDLPVFVVKLFDELSTDIFSPAQVVLLEPGGGRTSLVNTPTLISSAGIRW